jgi:hypothetical protein
MLLCLAGYAGAPLPRVARLRACMLLRGASTGKVPASMAARTQARAAAWNSLRHNGEQNRCGLPPVVRGKNCRRHQGQQTGSVIVNFEACSLTLGDEAADGTEPPELRLAILAGLGNSGSPPWV